MKNIKLNNIKPNEKITLPATGSWPKTVHVFDEASIWAIKAALAAQRPLLLRGEPGTGKSQLARAAAHALNRAFVFEVVHARSECQELQWHFDAVGRLGEAQAIGIAGNSENKNEKLDPLDPLRFLTPGALWWTLNWESAEQQFKNSTKGVRKPESPKGWTPAQGCVLLIDEIDKADADLPNGLLETLGNGAFAVPHIDHSVRLPNGARFPLVVITTNEERELPPAFIRRCMVMHLKLPKEKDELVEWLKKRGRMHFPHCPESVLAKAAELLWTDRSPALDSGLPAPGQAEYLDILRALTGIERDGKKRLDETEQLDILEEISGFALKKHPEESR